MIRSWLFVPADSERKLAKGGESGADALILDLEDSVAATRRPVARGMVVEYLAAHAGASRRPQLWVRINPLDGEGLTDAAAVEGFEQAASSGPSLVDGVEPGTDRTTPEDRLPR